MNNEEIWDVGVTSTRKGFNCVFFPVLYDPQIDIWHGYSRGFVTSNENISYGSRKGDGQYFVVDRGWRELKFGHDVRKRLYAIKMKNNLEGSV